MLKYNLCSAICGTDSVTHNTNCKYEDHITYKKANGKLVILRIKNNNESCTIEEYNKNKKFL